MTELRHQADESRHLGKRVALVVDHPQRDLAGLLLTAYQLCQAGVVCHLVPLNLQHKELWALCPDFVLLNYVREYNRVVAERLDQARIAFGMLDTEGGVWETFEGYTELLWASPGQRRKVNPVCMWGPAMSDHLVREGYFARDQVVVTGCPRFDFYAEPWRGVLDGLDGSAGVPMKGKDGGRILINTNFSTVNPRFTTRDQSIAYCMREYGWSMEFIEKVTGAEEQAIADTIDIASRLSTDFPGTRIVVRPHPHEHPRPYEQGLKGLPNAEINLEGSVQSQIFSADVVVQRSCTTAIEAGMARVPTLSPQWVPAPYLMQNAEEVSVPCKDYPELRHFVGRILEGTYTPSDELNRRVESVIHSWFYRLDGDSHARVADAVLEMIATDRTVDEALCRRYVYDSRSASTALDRIGRGVRELLRLSPDWSFTGMRPVRDVSWVGTSKYLDPVAAQAVLERIQSAAAVSGAARRVRCLPSLARGDFKFGYQGHSLTVFAE